MQNKLPKKILVNNKMQKNYVYQLTEFVGKNFDPRFRPDLTPKEMLELGVFGGKYLNDCKKEYPRDWFLKAKLSPSFYNKELNFFKVRASQPLAVWKEKGWIWKYDPRGWFEWYCRYFMGRRVEGEDDRQIKRWINMKRHISQIKKNCRPFDLECRKVQRQALLHWAYDSRKL